MIRTYLNSIALLALTLSISVGITAPAHAEKKSNKALFEITMGSSRFVIQVQGRPNIQNARRIIRSKSSVFMLGLVVPAPRTYNRKWKFHVAPNTIQFVELAMEVCDAAPKYVQEHLAEVGGSFLPGNIWCPWSSVLSKEIKQ